MRDGEERTQLDRHIRESVTAEQGTPSVLDRTLADSFYAALPEAAYRAMRSALEKGLREGGIGFGLPHQYTPGADRNEIFEVFRLAAEFDVPIFTHVRSMTLDAMQEVIANAAATGAPLHIVHVNSMSLGQLPSVLALIGAPSNRGWTSRPKPIPTRQAPRASSPPSSTTAGRRSSESPTEISNGKQPASG